MGCRSYGCRKAESVSTPQKGMLIGKVFMEGGGVCELDASTEDVNSPGSS